MNNELNTNNSFKQQTILLNKKCKAEAKAKKIKSLDELNEVVEKRKKTIQEEYESSLEASKASSLNYQPDLTKAKQKRRKDLKALEVYRKSQIRLINSTYREESKHRSFVSVIDAYYSRPPLWLVNLVTVIIFLAVFFYASYKENLFSKWSSGYLPNIAGFFKGFIIPDYGMFFGTGAAWTFETSVLYLCIQTFAIAFMGTLISAILSIPFGFFASQKLFGKWSYISVTLLIIIRCIPEIIFCYVLITSTGFGPLTGVVVLSIQSIGMIGKMYADSLDSMNMHYLEALDSLGATTISKIRVGVWPQVFPNFLSTVLYRFDLNLRTASILGLVGAGDLGRLLLDFSNKGEWRPLGSLIWGLLIMIILLDLISTKIRKKLV